MSRLRSVRPLVLALGVAVALSACGGGDTATTDAAVAAVPEGALAVTGTDALKFDPTTLRAPAGDVTLALACEGRVAHDIVIEETGDKVATCNGGGSGAGTVTLEAGDYTYYCSLPGHRGAGMEGTLTVG